jgi:hypothetical protein
MSDKQVIKHAIERSKSHNEIVRVEIQDGLSLERVANPTDSRPSDRQDDRARGSRGS